MGKGILPDQLKPDHTGIVGGVYATAAFLIWGLSPLYWKALKAVPAFEILMHRMIWSFLFFLPIILLQRRFKEFIALLKDKLIVVILLGTTVIVGFNWFLFIWAINHDHVLQTSLGYYINPLVNVFLGLIFLKERLRHLQIIAVVLAGISVAYQTVSLGGFPWIALGLAFSFGFYGLIRKVAPVGALMGLSVETLLLSIPALMYTAYLHQTCTGAILRMGRRVDLLLIGSAFVTALPLLLFTHGARRINLTTLGFLQYIAPSCTFLLAVFYYHERLTWTQVGTFVLIWIALGIYSIDSVLFYRRGNNYIHPKE
jgi:chloramphenicol-sensitive protein RarD